MLVRQAGRRCSAVMTGKDYLDFRLSTTTAQLMQATLCVRDENTHMASHIYHARVLRDNVKMMYVECFHYRSELSVDDQEQMILVSTQKVVGKAVTL